MRKMLYIQYATMFVLAFVSGVACYQLFELEQVLQVIEWGDRRLLTQENQMSIVWSMLPLLLAVSMVLFFSTHRYLPIIAPVFIAVKMTFFGFSSVFLLIHHESIKLYGLWWFPFQLIYCMLLVALYHTSVSRRTTKLGQKVVSKKRVWVILFSILLVFSIEIVVISMLNK